MNTWTAFRSAWRALTTNLMRSILTMLGIIIGVAAVITTIAIGNGAQQSVRLFPKHTHTVKVWPSTAATHAA